jgi:hypothetical protein
MIYEHVYEGNFVSGYYFFPLGGAEAKIVQMRVCSLETVYILL